MACGFMVVSTSTPSDEDRIRKAIRSELGSRVSVALETNGKGFIGHIEELPGAYIRGATEDEALSKVPAEVEAYLRWLQAKGRSEFETVVTQRHVSSLAVEDADNEILLDVDRREMLQEELDRLIRLVTLSGETFLQACSAAELKNWVDTGRIRRTFYGERPCSIQSIFDHVNGTQYYYLSRMKISFVYTEKDFANVRRLCVKRLREIHETGGANQVHHVDREYWTLKKVLRRYIWHDRIHGKAIVRILDRQRRAGLIAGYEDPFRFFERGP